MPAKSNDGRRLLIYDVQRFCLHDGPGLRTVVFLKGCPLRCAWCQNPESISPVPEIAFHADRCCGCMSCAPVCPKDAITGDPGRLDRARCDACGACADACPNEALRLAGHRIAPEDLLSRINRDRGYYGGDGGVTLSGGEPLMQAGPAASFLEICRAEGIGTAVETSGAAPQEAFRKLIPHTGLFLFDLKGGVAGRLKDFTGAGLAQVAENARLLVETGVPVVFRMPVIPRKNDSEDDISAIAGLLDGLGQDSIRLLKYHAGGEAKADRFCSNRPKLGITGEEADDAVKTAISSFWKFGILAVPEAAAAPGNADTRALFSDRVWNLRREVQSAKPAVCIERAVHLTEYFRDRKNRKKPAKIRQAGALMHILSRRSVAIHDGELLVGNFSSKRVGGSLFPELHHTTLAEDLPGLDRREINPLAISLREKLILATKVLPFWAARAMAIKAFPFPENLRFTIGQLKGREYLINESGGISHLVPDYGKLLRLGTSGISSEAQAMAGVEKNREKRDFYLSVVIACEALEKLAEPYAAQARRLARDERSGSRRRELLEIASVCERVPRHPAATLREAFQSILFAQIALNLESLDNSVCPGRLDQLLNPYYEADLESGRIDEAGARDLVGCFTVKMSEIVPIFGKRITAFHGGMFNGQVVTVGGVDRDGRDAENGMTWLFLDAIDALRMRQPNYHARIHKGCKPEYEKRVLSMIRDGSGAPSLMNDDSVIPMLVERGTEICDARDYSPVGCVEPVACGSSFCSTDAALFNLALCLERALGLKGGGARTMPAVSCKGIHDLVEIFRRQVEFQVDRLVSDLAAIEQANAARHPTPLTSMLLEGCMESGIDSTAGGARYNASGVQGVGIVDVGDSLAAIDEVVFRRRLCDMKTLVKALEAGFSGYETLRGRLLKAPKYGNDDPAADAFASEAMKIFTGALERHRNTRGGRYAAGFYSVTAHQAFGGKTGALPSGRQAGRPLANGLSPSNGMDRYGPTAVLNSVSSLPLARCARNGMNLNLKFDRGSVGGAEGIAGLQSLVRGYFDRGGMQVQMNIFDPAELIEAMRNPESHPWLLVRVSGYSAYFSDLSPAMKREIIERTGGP